MAAVKEAINRGEMTEQKYVYWKGQKTDFLKKAQKEYVMRR